MKQFMHVMVFVVALTIIGCSNEEPCEEESFGHIDFINQVDNRLDLYVDGNRVGYINGNSSFRHQVSSGTKTIEAIEDVAFFPRTWNNSLFLEECETETFTFFP